MEASGGGGRGGTGGSGGGGAGLWAEVKQVLAALGRKAGFGWQLLPEH